MNDTEWNERERSWNEGDHHHRWQPAGMHGDKRVYVILVCECGKVIRREPENES